MTDPNARLAEVQRELADSFAGPDADDNDGHAMALECERRDILAELAAREANEATRRGTTMMYRISTWDPLTDEPDSKFSWIEQATAPTLLALRPAIREVRQYYDSVSYLIEQIGD